MRDGSHWILDSDFQGDATETTVQWRAALFDLESLVDTYEVRLEDMDTDAVVAGPFPAGKTTRMTIRNQNFTHAQRLRGVVTAINRAGARKECATNGVLIDLTGPVPKERGPGDPVVWDGNSALRGYEGADAEYTWATRSAFVTWKPFQDVESGVNNAFVWVENMNGSVMSARVWVHRNLAEYTLPIKTRRHGDMYRVAVEPVNRAGSSTVFRTNGVEVDTTPPTFDGSVEFRIDGQVGLEPHIIAAEGARISVLARAVDKESGIRRCQYALGTYAGGSDVTGVVGVEVDALNDTLADRETRSRGGNRVCFYDDSCSDIPASTHTVATRVHLDRVLNEGTRLLNHFTFYAWIVCVNK